MKTRCGIFLTGTILGSFVFVCVGATVTNMVPGTANPWLAGMPESSTVSCGDTAPAQSPVQITNLPLVPGDLIHFEANGAMSLGDGYPFISPDGDPSFEIRNPAHDAGSDPADAG